MFSHAPFVFALAVSLASAAPSPFSHIDGSSPAERMAALQAHCVGMDLGNREARAVMIPVAARIVAGREKNEALTTWGETAARVFKSSKERLDKRATDNNARNPFEKHALIHTYMICREKAEVPETIVADMKRYVELYKHREWFGYDALNYRLMNDGPGFIAAEIWPDLKDSDGLDSAAIREVTKKRLFGYFDEIVRQNTDEYGAPTYLGINFSAVKLLADFAKDPEMRKRAGYTLDSMLLHVACAWNQGYYVTPASRAKYFGSTMTGPDAPDTTAAIGWLYFGGARPVDAVHMNPGGSFWFTVKKNYQPPAIFTAIANDRSQPFTHRGALKQRVRFTIHHEHGYSIASQVEDLTNPNDGFYKESRRTMFKWVSDKPQSTFTPLQDNPQRPYRLGDGKANAFGYGENPFTQVLQHERTLIGITSVPDDYPHWKMYAPFTTTGAIVKRVEKDGWVFCHGGSALFAFRYAQPAHWEKHRPKENCDVLRSEARNNGWLLITAPVKDFAGGGSETELARFSDTVIQKSRFDVSSIDAERPKLTARALDGTILEITHRPHKEPYKDQHRINGKAVPYDKFPHFGNPWLNQPLGDDKLVIRHKGAELSYDFLAWSRSREP